MRSAAWSPVHPHRSIGLTTVAWGDPPSKATVPLPPRLAASKNRRGSQRARLFVALLADVQAGPAFIAVYLTAQNGRGSDVRAVDRHHHGLLADAGRRSSMPRVRAAGGGLAVAAIGCTALALRYSRLSGGDGGRHLRTLASCVLGPAIAAISLAGGPLAMGAAGATPSPRSATARRRR